VTRHVSSPGKWYPLGATCLPGGVNFALHSEHATGVVLLLFDAADTPACHAIRLGHRTRQVWHGFVAGLRPGQLYGYRVEGPYQPERGLRFNPNKVLIDPHARALHGRCRNVDNILLGDDASGGAGDLGFDTRDDAAFVPKAVVVDDHDFDWAGDRPPALRLEETVVYEVHPERARAHDRPALQPGAEQPGDCPGGRHHAEHRACASGGRLPQARRVPQAGARGHVRRRDLKARRRRSLMARLLADAPSRCPAARLARVLQPTPINRPPQPRPLC